MTNEAPPKIGYMNPPQHSRFKRDQSGNPRGRPRKRDDLNTVLHRALNRKFRIKDDDQKLPIRDALMWRLRELALQGDKQAIALQQRIIDEAGIADPSACSPEEKSRRILRNISRMEKKAARKDPPHE